MSDVQYIRRIFDPNGVFVRREIHDPLRTVGTPAEREFWAIMVNADAQLTMNPAYREQTVRGVYQTQNEIIPLGTFPEAAFVSQKPIYWIGDAEVKQEQSGAETFITPPRDTSRTPAGGYTRPKRPIQVFTGDFCMAFTGRPRRTLDQAAFVACPNVPLKKETGLELEISFDYRMKSRQGYYKIDIALYFEALCGDRFLSVEPLQWQLGRNSNAVFIGVDNWDSWQTHKITVPGVEADGDFSLRFYQPVFYDPNVLPDYAGNYRRRNPDTAHGTLEIDNVSIRLLYNGGEPAKEATITYINDKKYSLVPDADEITHADVPEYLNAELIYPYAWRVILPDGSRRLTRSWRRHGYAESARLIELVLTTLSDANRKPTRKITCTLSGLLSPHHYVRVTYDENRIYKINAFSWDVRAREVQVELVEVLTGLPIQPSYRLLEDRRLRLTENYVPRLTEPFR